MPEFMAYEFIYIHILIQLMSSFISCMITTTEDFIYIYLHQRSPEENFFSSDHPEAHGMPELLQFIRHEGALLYSGP